MSLIEFASILGAILLGIVIKEIVLLSLIAHRQRFEFGKAPVKIR